MHIYVENLSTLTVFTVLSFLAFTGFLYLARKKDALIKTISAILLLSALYGVLSYTVLYRTPSNNHEFALFASIGNEFFREMFMNALLYYPFGLTLTVLIGPWSILVAFILSLMIETWQFFAGTGLAQGTDVIMNTLGCAIGALPWFIVRWIEKVFRKK